MKPVKKAIFPVGGLGTRFLPATKSIPKEMLPILTKPLIQYAFEEARLAGIEHFIFITGRNKNAISNHFDHAYELQSVLSETQKSEALAQVRDWLPETGSIAFVRQREPLGLGHAVWCARHFIGDEPFAVLLADELFLPGSSPLEKMLKAYAETGGNILGLAPVPLDQTKRYGIVEPLYGTEKDPFFPIKTMVEKPKPEEAPSNLSIVGRYILNHSIFDLLEDGIRGALGEIQLTDAMRRQVEREAFYGVVHEEARFDCGEVQGFLEANIAFALKDTNLKNMARNILEKYTKS